MQAQRHATSSLRRLSARALAFRGLVAIGALFLAGCATPPAADSEHGPSLSRAARDRTGLRDLRAEFRVELCSRLDAKADRPCADVLVAAADEAPAPPPVAATVPVASRFRIAIVPGLLAECLKPAARPFVDAIAALREQGFEVVDMAVGGRTSSVANAALLASEIAALPDDGRPLIMFAYSKGLPDALEMAVRYPQAGKRVAAIVGIAGAFGGSPLAEDNESLYRATLMRLPFDRCAAGDGEELRDLRRDVRQAWWSEHGAQVGIPLYSIAALPDSDQLSPALKLSYSKLAKIDPLNDSQLLLGDAVAVPGALLGFVNADHWGIAMRLSEAMPLLAPLFEDDVPRAALLRAAIEVVARDLAQAR
ncbi:hypothetical protein [Rivibacter subsaxonicus]|uniref:Alpha/beta hydrolase n=1 Tax=Rivibacter subsaxonicus TaxID=457575 RepID=A0A4Q7VGK3_9BURK|nr:hypothetical protein [Rivibacter subsaxonicus]RZT95134.1 hypothetical protein EV670_2883 [Rivibacter subsaxonicus]